MSKDYGLSFISNEDLFLHVKEAFNSKTRKEITLTSLKCNSVFHQGILKSIISNKHCLSHGFDLIDKDKKIFAEVKSKCPSMNSFSARNIYIKMQHTVLSDSSSCCYLVELFAEPNKDTLWKITIDGQKLSHNNIRRISIAKFYQQITGVSNAFKELCRILPIVFDDVIPVKV